MMSNSEVYITIFQLFLPFLYFCVFFYLSYAGWAKKISHKTETFILFGKIVKKLIITGVNKYYYYYNFCGELELFFFEKLENIGKGII